MAPVPSPEDPSMPGTVTTGSARWQRGRRVVAGAGVAFATAAEPGEAARSDLAGQGYLPALDGLRAVAVLLVVASHAGLERAVPGGLGVTVFFAVSGFLITRQIVAQHRRDGRVGLGRFYRRRLLRLVPAWLAYVALAGGAFVLAGGWIGVGGWAAALGQGSNYYQLASGYRSVLPGVRHPFNILWSLAVEDHFYLLWPVALLACLARGRLGWALGLCLAACALVLAWRLWLLGDCFAPRPGVWACLRIEANPAFRYNRLYLATDTRLDSIAWGAVPALLLAMRPAWGARLAAARALPALALGVLAASLALGSAWAATLPGEAGAVLGGPTGREALRTTVQGAALAVLVPAVALTTHRWRRALEGRAALAVGRASYSIYLWHWGAFALADGLAARGSAAWVALALPMAAGLSAASFLGVERPMLRARRRAGSHASGGSGRHGQEASKVEALPQTPPKARLWNPLV
jgi:peptidoglycan/LPS O-acetylase OafA/YrhL